MNGCIFNIQRFSLHDGPGIRTVVFFKGCTLNCVWCHNPEGISPLPQLRYSADKCIHHDSNGCTRCADMCSESVHMFSDGVHSADFSKCVSCMRCCHGVCPSDALSTVGQICDADFIMSHVILDEEYYRESKGGVTLSGGEPLAQPDFALSVLKECRRRGIHTAVETCAIAPREAITRVAEFTCLFLVDFKLGDASRLRKYTGADADEYYDRLTLINSTGAEIILRCPVIPGINDNEKHYADIAAAAEGYDGITGIELLPYHFFGVRKREQLGLEASFEASSPDWDTLMSAVGFLRDKTTKQVSIIG